MEIQTRIQNCSNLDTKELASFTFNALQAAPESRSEDRTMKKVEGYLQEIWDPRKSQKLVPTRLLRLFVNTPL